MSIIPGSRIGPYEVMSPLGAGGMGVVFRARDGRLQRDVALKLLPDHFANDADRLSRFQREAQVLASLNHPNIAQIYGLEQSSASSCIVMELVEGETLAERLKRGPLPIDEMIQIAKQIVDALETAHERGIVHRDLKPPNIKLAPDGKVKILDFGLAKALAGNDADTGLSHSPTKVSGSMAGVIMGTAAYMSPEQARGKAVDARTDIWAFGCVLYEMLTARQAFTGETATDVIAKILEAQPQMDRLPAETPVPIRLLLEATFNKDPKQRLPHIGAARVFLNPMPAALQPPKEQAANTRSARQAWLVAAVLAIAFAGALVPAALYFRRGAADAVEMRFDISGPVLPSGTTGPAVSISPNGQLIAYIGISEGKRSIWIRSINSLTTRILTGTEDVDGIFWSADSRYLAFAAKGQLKKLDIFGGSATILTQSGIVGASGTWNRDGIILYAGAGPGFPGIMRVSSSGGDSTRVTTPDVSKQEAGHFVPQFLPDGRHFIYHAFIPGAPPKFKSYVGALDSKEEARPLLVTDITSWSTPPVYVEPGYLLFVSNGNLMAQPFDAEHLELKGEPAALADAVGTFTASQNGVVIYEKTRGSLTSALQLQWFDRRGNAQLKVGSAADYNVGMKLSPDGRAAALTVMGPGANSDIWIVDLDRGVPNRLTFDPAQDNGPVWEPDGKHVVFASAQNGGAVPNKLYRKSSGGVGTEELLFSGASDEGVMPAGLSPDGRNLVFMRARIGPLIFSIWSMPLSGDRKAVPFLDTAYNNFQPQLSPDGRWLAYSTNESGSYQIVVRTFPDPNGGRWQVTANGGMEPRWRKDGRELYYLALDGKLMAVPVRTDNNAFQADAATTLFQTPLTVPAAIPYPIRYDVAADGLRFLMIVPANTALSSAPGAVNPTPLVAIVNWTAALKNK